MILLLVLLMGVEAQCPEDRGRSSFREIVDAAHAQMESEKGITLTDVMAHLNCVNQILTPEDAVYLHGIQARYAAKNGDISAVAVSVLAARSIPLSGPPPAWLENVVAPQPAPWADLTMPGGTALFVDGSPAMARPIDRPAIYQAMGPGGIVLWTKYLSGEEDLPDGFTLKAPGSTDSAGTLGVEEKIETLKMALIEGDYDAVIQQGLPLADVYPEHKETFRSLVAIATDQKSRQMSLNEFASSNKMGPGRLQWDKSKRWPYRKDARKGVLVGFEVGTPSSVRLDWKIAGQVVDSIGLRVGFGMHFDYVSTLRTAAFIEPVVVEFNLAREWQLETGLGLAVVDGSPVPMLGLAGQWDPDNPIQVSFGGVLDIYGVAPRAAVGFM